MIRTVRVGSSAEGVSNTTLFRMLKDGAMLANMLNCVRAAMAKMAEMAVIFFDILFCFIDCMHPIKICSTKEVIDLFTDGNIEPHLF